MKTRSSVLVVLLVFMCLMGWVGRGRAQKTNPQRIMWEYKISVINTTPIPSVQAQLNGLGEEGWELVAVHTNPPYTFFYFKRAKE